MYIYIYILFIYLFVYLFNYLVQSGDSTHRGPERAVEGLGYRGKVGLVAVGRFDFLTGV